MTHVKREDNFRVVSLKTRLDNEIVENDLVLLTHATNLSEFDGTAGEGGGDLKVASCNAPGHYLVDYPFSRCGS